MAAITAHHCFGATGAHGRKTWPKNSSSSKKKCFPRAGWVFDRSLNLRSTPKLWSKSSTSGPPFAPLVRSCCKDATYCAGFGGAPAISCSCVGSTGARELPPDRGTRCAGPVRTPAPRLPRRWCQQWRRRARGAAGSVPAVRKENTANDVESSL